MNDGLLEIKVPKISDVAKRLKGMQGKAPLVISRAINNTITQLKKEMASEARKEYVVKPSVVTKTLKAKKARQSDLSGIVSSTSDKKLPLLGFKNKPAKRVFPNPPDFYKSQVLQESSLKALSGSSDRSKAFIATMSSGHTGLYQRTGKKTKNQKQQIAELFGPSIPSMFKGKKTAKQVQDKGKKYLQERLDFHINKVLEAAK